MCSLFWGTRRVGENQKHVRKALMGQPNLHLGVGAGEGPGTQKVVARRVSWTKRNGRDQMMKLWMEGKSRYVGEGQMAGKFMGQQERIQSEILMSLNPVRMPSIKRWSCWWRAIMEKTQSLRDLKKAENLKLII